MGRQTLDTTDNNAAPMGTSQVLVFDHRDQKYSSVSFSIIAQGTSQAVSVSPVLSAREKNIRPRYTTVGNRGSRTSVPVDTDGRRGITEDLNDTANEHFLDRVRAAMTSRELDGRLLREFLLPASAVAPGVRQRDNLK